MHRDIQSWLSPNPQKNHDIACESHHEGTAAWFIESDMKAKDNNGSRTLTRRARCGHDGQGQAWVHSVAFGIASREHRYRTYLLEHGADVTAKNDSGSTPLHEAVWKDRVDLARSLVKSGANATANSKVGSTPLYSSVRLKDMELARFLIGHGARAVAQDEGGWVPLHWAMRAQRIDLARLLLERGADATAKTSRGWTPLHLAMWRGRDDLVRLLIEYSADTTATGMYKDGSTPLHLAVSTGSRTFAQCIRDCQGQRWSGHAA